MLATDYKLKNNVWASLICSETTTKLFGMTVDNKLYFDLHLNRVCKKVNHKLLAYARVCNYIKLRMIEKAFIRSQFGYFALV